MPESAQPSARLYLVTPRAPDLSALGARLEQALGAGDIAAVLIAGIPEEHEMMPAAETLVPLIQAHGAAALLENHVRIAARTGADGVHISSGLGDLKNAVERLKPRMIVGAGAVMNRHAAMQAGETGADYVFFGKPHGDIRPQAHHKNLDLAAWWCEIVEVPAVVMAGSAVESVADAAATGADFVALHEACWSHPDGPDAAVREALDLISEAGE